MQTNLHAIKDVAITLLYIEPEPVPELPVFLTHPYFESRAVFLQNNHKLVDIIENPEALQMERKKNESKNR